MRPLFLLSWLTTALLAQQATSPAPEAAAQPGPKGLVVRPPDSPSIRDASGRQIKRLWLDVVVTDGSGKPVAGLTQQDFFVLDAHQRKELLSFREVHNPGPDGGKSSSGSAQIILLVDTANNTFESVSAERQQIEQYLGQRRGSLPVPVSIALLSDSGVKIDQPSRDGKLLTSELRKTSIPIRTIDPATGGQGDVERAQLSLRALSKLIAYEKTQPGRKLLIWIGPGWPALVGAQFDARSRRDRRAFWDGVISFSTGLRESRITLYGVDSLSSGASVAHGVFYQNFLKGVTGPADVSSGNLALPVLVIQSGGRVVNGSNDLAGEIATCAADSEAYYEISFPTLPSSDVNEYRSLEVKVDKSGFATRTNTAYYAQP